MSIDVHCPDTFAVIVTYNPDLAALEKLMALLLPQVGGAVVVDNGSACDMAGWFGRKRDAHVTLQLMRQNLGIATAQNVGIRIAQDRGFKYVLLSDQDSAPAPDMVYRLRAAAEQLLSQSVQLAAVGPRYTDERQQNPPPFIQVKGIRVERQYCPDANAVVKVDYLIASGCLVPLTTVGVVGGMHDSLFIDYVDIEWGLRARQRGFQSYGVCAALMEHSLGDAPISFMGKKYPSHSPLRHYYHFRNAVWLYKQRFVPMHWKIADAIRLLRKYVFYSIFSRPRRAHLRMMTVGVAHGLRSRLGALQPRPPSSTRSSEA